jgi:hypothetical protein
MMMVRRKSEDREPFHWITSRRPTAIEMISATATRRAVFAMMPAGLAAVANSDIAAEDTFMCYLSAFPAIVRGARVAVDRRRPRDHCSQEADTEPAGLGRFAVARIVIITTTNMRRGSRARQRYATNGGFPAMNRENTVRA